MDGKLTLHHLNNSQSQVILWLLEELEIPYELKLYERQKTGPVKGRAPESLKQVHPLAKSPTLVTPNGDVIIERSAIALYLINTYDTSGRFKTDQIIREDMLISFSGASLNPVMLIIMTFDLLGRESPWVMRPIMNGLASLVKSAFLNQELRNLISYLETELGESPYFTGSSITRADFMIMWPVDFCHQTGYINLDEFASLKAWYLRCKERQAWSRSITKGNGYDMKNPI